MPQTYVGKPREEIQAAQYLGTPEDLQAVRDWVDANKAENIQVNYEPTYGWYNLYDSVTNTAIQVNPGDYLILKEDGAFVKLDPVIFEILYQPQTP